jgi:simple sugar transport system ATP-binding protein
LGEGCVPTLSVAENLVLKTIHRPPFTRGLLLDHAVIEAYARRLISTFDIKAPSPWARTTTLSGGNIQKLLLAREMSGQPGVLICNKPTQGLDLKTTRFVWHMLQTQASQGTAILLISTELEELLVLCDRIGIIYNGRLIDTVARGVDRERLGQLMVSGQP